MLSESLEEDRPGSHPRRRRETHPGLPDQTRIVDWTEWTRFIESAADASPFHRREWLEPTTQQLGAELIRLQVCSGEEPVGVCPLVLTKMGAITTTSPPFGTTAPYLGPVWRGLDLLKETSRLELQESMVRALMEISQSRSPRRMTLSLAPEVRDVRPFVWSGFRCHLRYVYRTPVDGTRDSGNGSPHSEAPLAPLPTHGNLTFKYEPIDTLSDALREIGEQNHDRLTKSGPCIDLVVRIAQGFGASDAALCIARVDTEIKGALIVLKALRGAYGWFESVVEGLFADGSSCGLARHAVLQARHWGKEWLELPTLSHLRTSRLEELLNATPVVRFDVEVRGRSKRRGRG